MNQTKIGNQSQPATNLNLVIEYMTSHRKNAQLSNFLAFLQVWRSAVTFDEILASLMFLCEKALSSVLEEQFF